MFNLVVKAAFATLRSAFKPASTFKTMSIPTYETLLVNRRENNVLEVMMNRGDKSNAMNNKFWVEMVDCFNFISETETRCVVLTAAGKNFTGGLDLQDFAGVFGKGSGDPARAAAALRPMIKRMQNSFTVIEECPVPVIAAIHRACIGGGIDMVTACDIRLCTADTYFSIKEVDIGLAADVGTLQRMPKVIGNQSIMRELAYTGRNFGATEALSFGMVSKIYETREECHKAAFEMADLIASKSPVAIQATKNNLNYSRDHSVAEGLDRMAVWNMSALQTDDLPKAAVASMQKSKPTFDDIKAKL